MTATRQDAPLRLVTEEQHAHYETEGYLHLVNVVPEDILTLVERPLRRWADDLIAKWHQEGRLSDRFEELPWDRRLNEAWFAAGKPNYSRSPRREVVSEEVFRFAGHPVFVAIARDLIGSDNIAAHGIFNARPKLQQQTFTNTPWHQDAQYFRESAGSHIVTMWVPLVDVDEQNSCLQVAPGHHRDELYPNYEDPETKFIGLSPEARDRLVGKPIVMKRGDVLCFNQLMPHAALPNHTDRVRWSMDIRFESTDAPRSSALDRGFVCAHTDSTEVETSYQHWFSTKWENHSGGY